MITFEGMSSIKCVSCATCGTELISGNNAIAVVMANVDEFVRAMGWDIRKKPMSAGAGNEKWYVLCPIHK